MAPTVMVTTRKRVRSCQAINLGIVLVSVVLLPLVVAVGSQSGPADPVKTESGGNSGSIPPPAPAVPEVGGQQSQGGPEDPSAQGGSGVGVQQSPIEPKDPPEQVDPVVGAQQSPGADPPKQNSLVSEKNAEEAKKLLAQADRTRARLAIKVILIFVDQIKKEPTGQFVANLLQEYEEIDKAVKSLESAAQIWKNSTNPSDKGKAPKELDELGRKWDEFDKRNPLKDVEQESKFESVRLMASDEEIKTVDDLAINPFKLIAAFKGNNQDQVKQIDTAFQELKSKVDDLYNKYDSPTQVASGTAGGSDPKNNAEEAKELLELADGTHKVLPIKVILIFAKQIKTDPTGQFVANLLQEYEEIDKAAKSLESAAQIWKDSTTPSDQGKAQKELDELERKWEEFEKRYPEDELDSKFLAVRQNASDDEYKLVDQLVGSTFQLVKEFKANNQDQVNQIDSTFQELKSKVEDLYTKYHGTGTGVSGNNPPPAGSSCNVGSCLLYSVGAAAVIALIGGGALWYSPALLNWAKNQVGLGPSVPETTEMVPTNTTELSITDSPSEASEFWIIVAVVALIAALAVAFYYFVVRKRTSSSQDTEGANASDGAPTGKTQQATGDKSTQAPVTATPSTGTSTTPSGNVKSKTGAQRSVKVSPSTASSGAITSSKASAQEKPKSSRATSSKVPSGTPKA